MSGFEDMPVSPRRAFEIVGDAPFPHPTEPVFIQPQPQKYEPKMMPDYITDRVGALKIKESEENFKADVLNPFNEPDPRWSSKINNSGWKVIRDAKGKQAQVANYILEQSNGDKPNFTWALMRMTEIHTQERDYAKRLRALARALEKRYGIEPMQEEFDFQFDSVFPV